MLPLSRPGKIIEKKAQENELLTLINAEKNKTIESPKQYFDFLIKQDQDSGYTNSIDNFTTSGDILSKQISGDAYIINSEEASGNELEDYIDEIKSNKQTLNDNNDLYTSSVDNRKILIHYNPEARFIRTFFIEKLSTD